MDLCEKLSYTVNEAQEDSIYEECHYLDLVCAAPYIIQFGHINIDSLNNDLNIDLLKQRRLRSEVKLVRNVLFMIMEQELHQ